MYSLDEIRQIIHPIAEKYRLPAVYLFGSYARGTATEHSDLDLLVDTTGTEIQSLLSLGALYNDLEEAFSVHVDLITVNSLTQHAMMTSEAQFQDTVLNERVIVYSA